MSPDRALDTNGRLQCLTVGGGCMNLVDDLHPFNDAAKGGEALAIRISFAAEIQLRLFADADKKVMRRRVGSHARHREGAIEMAKIRVSCSLDGNRWKSLLFPRCVRLRLDDSYFDGIIRLIRGRDRTKEDAVAVKSFQNIEEKVLCRNGSALRVELNTDPPMPAGVRNRAGRQLATITRDRRCVRRGVGRGGSAGRLSRCRAVIRMMTRP